MASEAPEDSVLADNNAVVEQDDDGAKIVMSEATGSSKPVEKSHDEKKNCGISKQALDGSETTAMTASMSMDFSEVPAPRNAKGRHISAESSHNSAYGIQAGGVMDPHPPEWSSDDEKEGDNKSFFGDKDDKDDDNKSQDLTDEKPKDSPFLGAPYTQVEYAYAICVGVMLSFNAGYVNGSFLSGLVAPSGVTRAVTSHTGTTTKSALALASGDGSEFGFLVCLVLSFALGSFIAGSLTPKPAKAFRVEASYGPSFLLGAALLTISSSLAALEVEHEQFIFYLASAANGIQNGISSIYSSNLIRSTGVTATTTDIGIFMGQLLRGNRTNTWKLIVLLCLWLAFWMGGLISVYATDAITHFSLLFNAGLFLLIGGSVVAFLTLNLHVSLSAAIFGRLSCTPQEKSRANMDPSQPTKDIDEPMDKGCLKELNTEVKC